MSEQSHSQLPLGYHPVEFTRDGQTYRGSYRVVGTGPTTMVYLSSAYADVDPRRVMASDPTLTARLMLMEAVRNRRAADD